MKNLLGCFSSYSILSVQFSENREWFTCAAADVAIKAVFNLLLGWIGGLFQQTVKNDHKHSRFKTSFGSSRL